MHPEPDPPPQSSEAETQRICAFLERIGIPVRLASLPQEGFLPGIAICNGALLLDPDESHYPGDLLHEAGHIAVTAPALRPALATPSNDPAEEMAALAWSYAAAIAAEIDPAIVFHHHGYKGEAESLLTAFRRGGGPGVPMLGYWGMTATAGPVGTERFPAMLRWLR